MKRFGSPILVTRPYLPDLEEFKKGCEDIWASQWLTNNGPMVKRFHASLATYLGVPETNIALFNSGTLALEVGFHALGLSGGDVITTPFTFVATAHALKRIGANPIFAASLVAEVAIDAVGRRQQIERDRRGCRDQGIVDGKNKCSRQLKGDDTHRGLALEGQKAHYYRHKSQTLADQIRNIFKHKLPLASV